MDAIPLSSDNVTTRDFQMWAQRCSGDVTLKTYQVFGERRSGTNAVDKFLAKNTNLKRTVRYGWKHGFATYPFYPQHCLYVVVVRDPFDWLKSFYNAPFEVDPSVASLGFSEFLRAEWQSRFTPGKSGWRGQGYALLDGDGEGEELQGDRHPVTGARIENVVQLRNLKLQSHLSLMQRGLNCIVVRYEDFIADRAKFLTQLTSAFDLPQPATFENVTDYVGPKPKKPKTNLAYSDEDIEFIIGALDLDQERALGYGATPDQ